jgi:hypothetical protein
MVEFLLRHGADPSIKDPKVGGTASNWAEHGGHPQIGRYMEQQTAGG